MEGRMKGRGEELMRGKEEERAWRMRRWGRD